MEYGHALPAMHKRVRKKGNQAIRETGRNRTRQGHMKAEPGENTAAVEGGTHSTRRGVDGSAPDSKGFLLQDSLLGGLLEVSRNKSGSGRSHADRVRRGTRRLL